jgi:hypothetical protein
LVLVMDSRLFWVDETGELPPRSQSISRSRGW